MVVPYERGADLDRLQLIYRRTLYLTCKIKNHQKYICFNECIVARYPLLSDTAHCLLNRSFNASAQSSTAFQNAF